MAKANCISIDPIMRVNEIKEYFNYKSRVGRQVRRLTCYRLNFDKFLAIHDSFDKSGNNIVVFPHSHAPFEASIKLLNSKGVSPHVINMPCCKRIKNETKPLAIKTYKDEDIQSAKNEIFVFENLNLL